MAMHTWFECKIRYEKVMENGMNKKVTEPYLVDALSFTEAEARIIEESLRYRTSNVLTIANYSQAKKKPQIAGSNANWSSSLWMKRAELKRKHLLRSWYRLPTSVMPLRSWMKV